MAIQDISKRKIINCYLLHVLFLVPFLYWLVAVLMVWVEANFNEYVFNACLFVFVLYLVLCALSYNNAKWLFFQTGFLLLFGSIFNVTAVFFALHSIFSLSVTFLISGISTVALVLYFIKKQLQLDYSALKKELTLIHRFDFNRSIYYVNNTAKFNIKNIYRHKKKQAKRGLPDWENNILSWVLITAFYLFPIAPYALRGVDNNHPRNMLMYFCVLFFAWSFGYFAHLAFSVYRLVVREQQASDKSFQFAYYQ